MPRLAGVISIVLHPLIMPLMCVILAGQLDWYVRGTIYQEQLQLTYLVVALSTVVFPGLNILLLRWYGAVSDLNVSSRRERYVPYLSSIFFFVLGYVMLRRGDLPSPLYAIMLGSIASVVLLTLLNLRLKLSAHAAGVAGLLGTAVGLFRLNGWSDLPLLMTIILLCGLVLSSRLVLAMHSPREVYGGALIGFASLYFCITQLWVI
jgi:hypothetical protein